MQEVLDEVHEGCVVCWMLDSEAAEAGAWQEHKVMQCTTSPGITGAELDRFRRNIIDQGGCHSSRRC